MASLICMVMGSLLLFKIFCDLFNRQRQRQLKLPPGPKAWPIIGNLNLIYPFFHLSIHGLALKYGPIMHLRLGCHSAIIVSSVDMAKQFLKIHDRNFSYRPKSMAGKYLFYDYCNITFSPYGPYWCQIRKICQEELFSSSQLQLHQCICAQEVKSLVGFLFVNAGKLIVIKHHISTAGFNMICRMVAGQKYPNQSLVEKGIVGSDELPKMLDELFLLTGVLNIGDLVPWINFLDLQGYVKRMKNLRKKFDKLLDHIIDDIKTTRRVQGDSKIRTMVDALFDLLEEPNPEFCFTRKHIKAVLQDMIGGIETSTAVTEWAMSELLRNHQSLEKAREELEMVIGNERWVEEKDVPQLPYMEAIVKETMRLHPVGPMLAPRISNEHCNIAGYDIPAKTRVFINVLAIVRSPTVWESPENFIPERFLDGGENIDVIGQHFELLPFGSGRRMCPAYNLGMKAVTLTLANLLHGFEWKLPEKMQACELNMEEVVGLTMPRKVPLALVAQPRLPNHVYHF
ncbi:hypothetical protein F0562_010740 [Nyssa sinensis]|uniref:Uncharacterized protein n=1 Tax=Nyssa sinensis TaxID=561372 RepID=A0A5J5A2M1_9ASTE|nr:hypothetical protein F0562_010739 [Nyssa sinensis]KAA8524317.1 hypothetical protein F0562_010740 [Nyssa sinensis]